MLKKIVSLLVIFAMLVPFSFAVAADEPTSQPTIEEILNEYHQKAFDAQVAEQQAGASTYSRQASGNYKTLEQETVDTLTEAGYEAYNVTAENYTSLEDDLNTDFAEMGLDPDGSYVVVISGEDSPSATGRSIGGSDIVQNPGAGGGTENTSFKYTYNGYTYDMRYLTVTSADNPNLSQSGSATLFDDSGSTTEAYLKELFGNFLGSVITSCIDELFDAPVGTILSLFSIDINNVQLPSGTKFSVDATANWVRTYTQIYEEDHEKWFSWSSTDYVIITQKIYGRYYDLSLGEMVSCENTSTDYRWAEHYNDREYQCHVAARSRYFGMATNEYVGDVHIYNPYPNLDENGEIDPLDPFLYSDPVISFNQRIIPAPSASISLFNEEVHL